MRKQIVLMVILTILTTTLIATLKVHAATVREVGPGKTYAHPQDAVNAADPGDTVLVYPGTYGSRVYTTKPPHYSANDQYAPALIVYKNDLTIEAEDPDPSKTIIQSTHNYWSNPVAIQASTGGTWDGTKYVGAGVYPADGTAPNAIAVVASDVTIRGFTLRAPALVWNTAGVMIGGLYAGDSQFPGQANNDIVEDCVFEDVWHAVYVWHSSGNIIRDNTVRALGAGTGHWAAISTFDGTNDAQTVGIPNPSVNNLICNNVLADKGIALGAWQPPTWTHVTGSIVCCNTATQVGVTYAYGPVIIGCNVAPGGGPSGFWQTQTSQVIHYTGITYTGDLWQPPGEVTLEATLGYDGSPDVDGSGIQIRFTWDSSSAYETTVAGGAATHKVTLAPGDYDVVAKVTVYAPCCTFTDRAELTIQLPPPPVGGEWVPINTIQMLVQLVGSVAATLAIAASFVGFKRTKRKHS